MSEIQKTQLLHALYDLVIENFSVRELDELQRIGSEKIYNEIVSASYEKQEALRLKREGVYV